MIRVAKVLPGSIADELEIVPGTELLSVTGRALDDFLDWEFLTAEESLAIEAKLPDGEAIVFEVEREEGESFGIELEPPTVRRCANRCEFCFVEGLPKGTLRRNLYIRDDDYRLSFAYGNFATLSNLRERDYERILEYRLSPLYISVHATNWEARKKLLNNPRVPDVNAQLRRLVEGGIQFHGQMVVVPGLNDAAVLEESLETLWSFGESCLSVAVVPVGLTQFSHLYTGERMSRERAREILAQVERWGERAKRERGATWAYAADELYLQAARPFPEPAHYDDFAQIENGIGAVTMLRERVRAGLESLPRLDGRRIGVVTGRSMEPIMPEILDALAERTGARFELIAADNTLFAGGVTVAGLLVGADIRRVLAGRDDLDLALIPAETINEGGLFLDDASFVEVRESLPMPVYPSYDFIDALAPEGAAAERGAAAA